MFFNLFLSKPKLNKIILPFFILSEYLEFLQYFQFLLFYQELYHYCIVTEVQGLENPKAVERLQTEMSEALQYYEESK